MSAVDYTNLIKKLVLPDGRTAPARLEFDDIEAVAITREHLSDDVRGINASLELIRRTRGGGWPDAPVTEELNYVDLVWHELEFREGMSFTYAVYGPDGYLGCAYLYPMGRRTRLTPELVEYDVDVSWWVTPEGYEAGYYAKLHAALGRWLEDWFPFRRPYWSNSEIPPRGVAMTEPGLPARLEEIVAASRYMTIATAGRDGRPWASPVWFATADAREFLWISRPGARHSQNIAARPGVAISIFDSTQPPGAGEGVYIAADAALVPDREVDQAVAVYSRISLERGAWAVDRSDVAGDAPQRLYRAVARERYVLSAGDERLRID